ncbi:mobile mystery protein A [Iodidimonas sp. SYSU 1G8]|uniref:mobile mystery protein A n=1 Tax=Iodidimonas sp. SYSU 1G8 TaxID=3133967 RepID=UPI0031FEFA1D
MKSDQARLARKNLDRRLNAVDREALRMPPFGWVRAIREALGMSPATLGKRIGVTRPRINALEKAEITGSTTIKTLREAAEAMDCVLVYAIVPRASLDQTVLDQAEKKALSELARLHHTMSLENQELTSRDLADERARLMREILDGPPRRLWDDA